MSDTLSISFRCEEEVHVNRVPRSSHTMAMASSTDTFVLLVLRVRALFACLECSSSYKGRDCLCTNMAVCSGDSRATSPDKATRRWPWQSQRKVARLPATLALPGELSESERSSHAFRTSSFRPRNLQISLTASTQCIMMYIILVYALLDSTPRHGSVPCRTLKF
jgi:hypothetical protein